MNDESYFLKMIYFLTIRFSLLEVRIIVQFICVQYIIWLCFAEIANQKVTAGLTQEGGCQHQTGYGLEAKARIDQG